jgi:DNA polymerase-1
MTWPSATMGAIVRFSGRSKAAPDATNPATQNTSSGRASGCAAWSSRRRVMALRMLIGRNRSSGLPRHCPGDANMQAAYRSGDSYLTFAKQAGAVPADATKATHKNERELFKQCVLGVQYGMEAETLALRIGQPLIVARGLLRAHRETYRPFWRWSDAVVDHAMLFGSLHTVFGWHVHVGENSNPRSLRNFPMQANGAEMLRLACCLATERGIEVCAPVHDAVLICAPLDHLERDIAQMRVIMAEASRIVLNGFELSTDCPDEYDEHGKPVEFPHIIRHPKRFMDARGVEMWERVTGLITKRQSASVHVLVA